MAITIRSVYRFVALGLIGVSLSCSNREAGDEQRRLIRSVERIVHSEVKKGDSSAVVEAAMKRRGISFSYDFVNKCHFGGVEIGSVVTGEKIIIQIKFYFSENDQFKRTEFIIVNRFI